jgi:hypothetical protein
MRAAASGGRNLACTRGKFVAAFSRGPGCDRFIASVEASCALLYSSTGAASPLS